MVKPLREQNARDGSQNEGQRKARNPEAPLDTHRDNEIEQREQSGGAEESHGNADQHTFDLQALLGLIEAHRSEPDEHRQTEPERPKDDRDRQRESRARRAPKYDCTDRERDRRKSELHHNEQEDWNVEMVSEDFHRQQLKTTAPLW